MIEVLERAAGEAPERPAIVSGGEPASYGECLARAHAFGAGLALRGIERFGCAVGDPATVLALAAGSSAIGSEACLYPPDLDEKGLAAVASRFGHKAVVCEHSRRVPGVRTISVEELEAIDSTPPPRGRRSPVLILTTGTTGGQKGARHEWSRLIEATGQRDQEPGTRWLLTYNLNQFAGVQMLVHSLVNRATLVLPSSRMADDVIAAIRDHHVTHASATPTLWRLLAGRLDETRVAALPLRQITLGGEAVPQSLLDQLGGLFPAARISHVFAGTEFGSIVSVNDGRSGLPLSVLEHGPNDEIKLRVVDGELQTRSRGRMLGYYRHDDDPDTWRPTGDLVEIGPDRLLFVGRTSDVINVGGAKVHPLPVEELLSTVEGVELVSVYGHPNPVAGQIVAVDVVASPDADEDELPARIHEKCQQLPEAGRPRRVRIVSALETRGGKVMRRAGERG